MLHFILNAIPQSTKSFRIDYAVFFDSDLQQRGLLVVPENSLTDVVNNEEEVSLIFTPKRPHQKLDLTEA